MNQFSSSLPFVFFCPNKKLKALFCEKPWFQKNQTAEPFLAVQNPGGVKSLENMKFSLRTRKKQRKSMSFIA
jgi:hypothetical protein